MAAALDNTAILATLIEFGADVNIRITGGVTALHYASMENNPDAIRHVTLDTSCPTTGDNVGSISPFLSLTDVYLMVLVDCPHMSWQVLAHHILSLLCIIPSLAIHSHKHHTIPHPMFLSHHMSKLSIGRDQPD